MAVGHYEVRDACLDGLRQCTDTAVVNEHRRTRQHLAERKITDSFNARGQATRELLGKVRHEHRGDTYFACGLDRFLEISIHRRSRRSWCENQGAASSV